MSQINGYTQEEITDYARLASNAYNDDLEIGDYIKDENGKDTNYKVIDVDFATTFSGFGAIAARNTKTGEVVISYQGTDSAVDLFVADAILATFTGTVTNQTLQAEEFAKRVIATLDDPTNVTFVGHSLGGFLAQTVADNDDMPHNAVVFNSPGVYSYRMDIVEAAFIIDFYDPSLNYTYIYSEDWGFAGLIHGLGARLTDDVYHVKGTSGHSIQPLVDGLSKNYPVEQMDERDWMIKVTESVKNAIDSGMRTVESIWEYIIETKDFFYDKAENAVKYYQYYKAVLDGVILSGNNCFPAHTPISLPDGSTKPISDIRVNDRVLSFDDEGNLVVGIVTQLLENVTTEWLKLRLADDGLDSRFALRAPENDAPEPWELVVTPGHRFLRQGVHV